MPSRTQWLVPDVIVYQAMVGPFDCATAQPAIKELRLLLDDSDEPLTHVVLDMSQVTDFPTRIADLRALLEPLLRHPRLGWTIVYGLNDRVATFSLSLIAQMFQVRFRLVQDAADASLWIDASLPYPLDVEPLLNALRSAQDARYATSAASQAKRPTAALHPPTRRDNPPPSNE